MGILYKDNKFFGTYEPGVHHRLVDMFSRLQLIDVPTVEQTITITNQEVLTKDNIALRFSYYLVHKVVDAEKLARSFDLTQDRYPRFDELPLQDYSARIRLESQVSMRKAITAIESTELNTNRVQVVEGVHKEMTAKLKTWGLELVNIEIVDVTFPKDIQDLFAKQLEAKLRSQYELENARTQVASARALKNAAELIKGNEDIKYLQLLETLQKIASKGKHTFVLGDLMNQIK